MVLVRSAQECNYYISVIFCILTQTENLLLQLISDYFPLKTKLYKALYSHSALNYGDVPENPTLP